MIEKEYDRVSARLLKNLPKTTTKARLLDGRVRTYDVLRDTRQAQLWRMFWRIKLGR